MSPFLFIFCLEFLSRLLGRGLEGKEIAGIFIARGAPIISPYLYADDYIIFLNASYKNACNLRNILENFAGGLVSK